MSIGSFNMERKSLSIREKITLKLYYLRILAMEKIDFGKEGVVILTIKGL